MKYFIGIDEAGRGSLAGPVTVGAFLAEGKTGKKIIKNLFNNKLRDSKKLSLKKREEIFEQIKNLKKQNLVNFSVIHISPKIIDKIGILEATKIGVSKAFYKIFDDFQILYGQKNLEIVLDGLLKAPAQFNNQKTIIKGDEKNVFIACASVVAKVKRDHLMCRLSRKYRYYSLEIHKGYGTKLHYHLIKKYNLSPIHRKSFLKKFIK